MKYFAGLDVSLEETAICVVDETGQIMKEVRAASEPEALDALLSTPGLPLERLGLEACSLTAWLHGELKAAGWPAICIESRHAKAAMGAMPDKTDRNDARAIAQIMRTGWFRAVHAKTSTCRSWRSLLAARRTVLNEMRPVENVARAVLRETGFKPGTPARKDFVVRVRELTGGTDGLALMVKWPALRARGMKIAKRRGMARARAAVARKLATILHRMWAGGSAFRFEGEKAAPAGAPELIAATA